MTVGNRLKAELALRDMTIGTLAIVVGMKKQTLYRKITGESVFNLDEAIRIAKVLQLPCDKILYIFFDIDVSKNIHTEQEQ